MPIILGGMNGDGVVNNLDVAPLALAISDPAAYVAAYGLTDWPMRACKATN